MWKAYYADGTVISSKESAPENLPGFGLQVIVQEDDRHGWEIVAGKTYFCFEDRGLGPKWWPADRGAVDEYLFTRPGKKIVKMGRFIEDDYFDEIHRQAMLDPDFPKKTGYKAREKKP